MSVRGVNYRPAIDLHRKPEADAAYSQDGADALRPMFELAVDTLTIP